MLFAGDGILFNPQTRFICVHAKIVTVAPSLWDHLKALFVEDEKVKYKTSLSVIC